MAGGFEIPIRVVVDKSQLDKLQNELNNLVVRDSRQNAIKLRVDPAEAERAIREVASKIKSMSGQTIKLNLNTNELHKQASAMVKTLEQLKAAAAAGLDARQIFGKNLDKAEGISVRAVNDRLKNALDKQRKMLQNTMSSLRLDDSLFANSSNADYVINAMSKITEYAKNAGLELKTLGDGSLQFIQSMNGVATSIQTFDRAGESSTTNLQNLTKSFETAQKAAAAFNQQLTSRQRDSALDAIGKEFERLGVALDGKDLTSYFTKFTSTLDSQGNVVKAKVQAVVEGIKTSFNFTGMTDDNGQRLLLFDGIQTASTNIKSMEQQYISLKSTLKSLEQEYRSYYNAISQGDTPKAEHAQNRIVALEAERRTLQQTVNGYKDASQIISDFDAKIKQLGDSSSLKTTKAQDTKLVANLNREISQIEQAFKKITSLKIQGGHDNEITRLAEQIQQGCTKINQSLGDTGKQLISFNQQTGNFRFNDKSIKLEDIITTGEQLDRLKNKIEGLKETTSTMQGKLVDDKASTALSNLADKYTEIIAKYKEYQQALASGSAETASRLLMEAKGLEKQANDMQSSIQQTKNYSSAIKDLATSMRETFNTDKGKLFDASDLKLLNDIYKQIIQKVKEYNQAIANKNTSVAGQLRIEIEALSRSATELENIVRRRKTSIEQLNDMKTKFNQSLTALEGKDVGNQEVQRVNSIINEYQKLFKLQEQIGKLKLKPGNENEIKRLQDELTGLLGTLGEAKDVYNATTNVFNQPFTFQAFKDIKAQTNEAKDAIKNAMEDINASMSKTNTNQNGNSLRELINLYTRIIAKYKEYQQAKASGNTNVANQFYKEAKGLEKLASEMQQFIRESGEFSKKAKDIAESLKSAFYNDKKQTLSTGYLEQLAGICDQIIKKTQELNTATLNENTSTAGAIDGKIKQLYSDADRLVQIIERQGVAVRELNDFANQFGRSMSQVNEQNKLNQDAHKVDEIINKYQELFKLQERIGQLRFKSGTEGEITRLQKEINDTIGSLQRLDKSFENLTYDKDKNIFTNNLDMSKFVMQTKEGEDAIRSAMKSINNAINENTSKQNVNTQVNYLQEYNKVCDQIIAKTKELYRAQNSKQTNYANSIQTDIDKLYERGAAIEENITAEKALGDAQEGFLQRMANIRAQQKDATSNMALKGYEAQIKMIEQLQSKMESLRSKGNSSQTSNQFKIYEDQIRQATKELEKFGLKYNEAKQIFDFRLDPQKFNADAISKSFNMTKADAEQLIDTFKRLQETQNLTLAQRKDDLEAQQLKELSNAYDMIITKVRELNNAKLSGKTNTASDISKEINTWEKEAERLDTALRKNQSNIEKLNDLKSKYQARRDDEDVLKTLGEIDNATAKYKELFKLQERIGQLKFKIGSEGEVSRLQSEMANLIESLHEFQSMYDKTTNTFNKDKLRFTGFDDIILTSSKAVDALRSAQDSIKNIMTEGNAKQTNNEQIHNTQELIKLYDQLVAKKKEYYRALNAGDTNYANSIQSEINALYERAFRLSENTQQTESLAKAQATLRQELEAVNAQQRDYKSNEQLKGYENQLRTLEQLQSKIEALRLKSTKVESANQIDTYATQIEKIVAKLNELGITYDRVNNMFNIPNTRGLGTIGDLNTADIDKLNDALLRFRDTNERIQSKRYDIFNQQAIDKAITKLQELNRKKLELERSKLNGDSALTIRNLAQEVENLDREFTELMNKPLQGVLNGKTVGESDQAIKRKREEISKLNNDLSRIRAAAGGAGGGIKSLNGYVDNLIGKFVRMASSYLIFMQLQRAIYGSMNAIKELDSAMTNLQMITEKSDSQIRNMMSSYANMAKELGVTLQTVAEGSEEWLRQGFSEAQTEELLRASTMLSTVGNMEASQATESLTSILNGFNMEASQVMTVVDTLNQLDLKYATSAEELATAMQRVSSVAQTAGVNFQELASIITVVSSNTRLSAETIGNGIKSLLSRLQNIKVGKYLDDNNEALNDTEKVLNSLGVTLRDSATEWREPMKILDDVGNMWDNLTDIDKSAIATALGGTYQRNTLMSILENWDEVGEAMDVAADSAGSTEQKYEAYMDSLEARINQLKAVWSEFLMNLNTSDMASGFISAITSIVSGLDILINKLPGATMLITALTAALARFTVAKIGTIGTKIVAFAGALPAFKEGANFISRMGTALATMGSGFKPVIKGMETVEKGTVAAAAASQAGAIGFTSVGTASAFASGGVAALGAALSALLPYLAVIAAIGLAIWGVSKGIDAIVYSDEELQDDIDTARNNAEEAQNAIDGYNQKLEENKQRLEEINALRGTSAWSSELSQESSELERQNAILERKIAIEERNLELENRKLSKGYNEQFERNVADKLGKDTLSGNSPYFNDFVNANSANERALVMYKEQVRLHNENVQEAIRAQTDYLAISARTNVSDEERERAKEKMNKAVDKQAESEEKLIDIHNTLSEHYDQLYDDNQTLVDGLEDATNGMLLFNESADSRHLVTFGQHMEDIANAANNTISPVDELEGKLHQLSNIDITPVEDGFENIGEYLRSLDATTLEHLDFILESLGSNAEGFIAILSTMDASTQIDWINSKFNEFKGILEDCTAEYSEFKKLAESNPSEEMQGIADMYQYLRDSEQYGIERYDMYNAALKGLGASTYEEAEQIMTNVADLYDHATWTIKGTTTEINGSQEAISQFGKDILDLVRSSNGELGEFEETTRTLSGVTERELFDAYNKLREATGKGLINEELWSAQWADLDRYIIKDIEVLDALQQQFRDLSDTASDAMKELDDSLSDASIDMNKINIPVNGSNVKFTSAEKQKIADSINKAIDDIQGSLGTSGIKLDLPKIDASVPDIELQDKYNVVKNVSDQIQNLFQGNKFNIDPIKDIAESVNQSLGSGSVTIDGNKITFNTEAARNEFESKLKEAFEGIDVSTILANAMNNGEESLTFEFNGQVDTTAFTTQLQTQLQTAISGMQLTASEVFLNTSGLQATITEVGTTAEGTKKTITTSFDEAINYINGLSTSPITQQLNDPGSAAENSARRVDALKAAVTALDGSKATVTIEVNQKGTVPSSASSLVSGSKSSTKSNPNGYAPRINANGSIPGYAVGKRSSDGSTPMRASEHINAMVGEEGAELKIDKDGKQEMVGMNGPELIHVKPGDTIVPHNVTDMITKGKINQHAGGLKSYGGTDLNDNRYHSKTQGSGNSSGRSSGSSGGSSGRSSGSSGGYSSRSSGGSSSGGSSSSSSSSQQEKTDPAAEEELKQLEHNLEMERITQEEYVKEYTRIWEKYYKKKAQYRDEDWKMEEEIFKMQKEALEDQMEVLDHELTMAEHHNASATERIAILTKEQELLHQKAEESRARNGGKETEDSREASEEWWEKEEEKKEILEEERDLRREALEDEQELLEHEFIMAENHNATAEEKIAILKEQQALQHKIAEEERANNNGQDTEESREASEEWWEIQKNIEDIQHEVFDEQKAILDHQISLLDNQKDKVDKLSVELYNSYKDIYDNYKKLRDEANSLGVDLDKVIYGNIDLDQEALIEWTDEYIAKYKEALQSWGVNIESLKGKTSQVLGQYGTYDNVKIAYSAILQTDQGSEVLSKSTVDKYINQLITNAGKGWTTELLLALDKKGLEIDGKYVKNILAGIGEEAEKVSRAMHLTGHFGEVEQALEKVREVAKEANMSVAELANRLEKGALRKSNNVNIAKQEIALLEARNKKLHEMAEAERKAKNVEDNDITRGYSDEWWENKNKILEIQEEIYDNYIANKEHENFLSSKHNNSELQQIANLEEMQKAANKRANALRLEGYAEDSEAIRSLQQQWWDFEEQITALETSIHDNYMANKQDEIDTLERQQGTEYERLFKYGQMQYEIEQRIATLKKTDYTEYSELIRSLNDEYIQAEEAKDAIRESLYQNQLKRREHEISDLERTSKTEGKQILQLMDLQELAYAKADALRARGYAETSDEMMELAEQIWSYADRIQTLANEAFDDQIDDLDRCAEVASDAFDQIELTQAMVGESLIDYESRVKDVHEERAKAEKELLTAYKQNYVNIMAEIDRLAEENADANADRIEQLEDQARSIARTIRQEAEKMKQLALEEQKSKQDHTNSVIAGMQSLTQSIFIDQLEKVKELMQGEIDLLEEKMDAEDKITKEKELQQSIDEAALNLEKKKEALEKAKKNRVKRVYYAERGWVWEKDTDAIEGANKDLEDAKKAYEDAKKALGDFKNQQLINAWREQIDAISELIEYYNEYNKKLGEIPNVYEDMVNRLNALVYLNVMTQEEANEILNDKTGKAYNELNDTINSSYIKINYNTTKAYDKLNNTADKAYGTLNSNTTESYNKLNNTASAAYGTLNSNTTGAYDQLNTTVITAYGTLNFNTTKSYKDLNDIVKTAYGLLNYNTTESYNNLNTTASTAYGKLNSDTVESYNNLNTTVSTAYGTLNFNTTEAYNKLNTTVSTAYGTLNSNIKIAQKVQELIHKDMEDNLDLTVQNSVGYLGELKNCYVTTADAIKDIELTSIDVWEDALTDSLDNVEAQMNRAIEMVEKVQKMAEEAANKKYDYEQGYYGDDDYEDFGDDYDDGYNDRYDHSDYYDDDDWDDYYEDDYNSGEPEVRQALANGKAPKGSKIGDIITTHGGSFEIVGGSEKSGWETHRLDFKPSYADYGSRTDDWYYNEHEVIQADQAGRAPHGLKIGDIVTTHGGAYEITKVNSDGTYKSSRLNSTPYYAPSGSDTSHLYNSYANGGIIDYTGEAEVHGSDHHSEVVFNSEDAKKLWSMVHTYNPDYALANNANAIYGQLNKMINGISNRVHDTGTTINISNVNLPSVQQPNDFVRKLKTVSLNRKG